MRVAFSGQVSKDPMYPELNEDKFDSDLDKNRIALSDGATESYDSKLWASLLVTNHVKTAAFNKDWVEEQINLYLSEFDLQNLSWSKQAAFDRGSFATLVSVEYDESHKCVDVMVIGDSFVALINDNCLIDTYPYSNSSSFRNRPELISTTRAHNNFIDEKNFYNNHSKRWNIDCFSKPLILCMTDALGEWALTQHENKKEVWSQLLNIRSLDQLTELVITERGLKSMRVDDVTLMKLVFD